MLFDSLLASAAEAPRSGVHQAGRFTPYSEMAERAGRIATALIERGVARGTPVGILMVNGPELLTLAYAVFAAGGIAVPLNAHAPRPELAATARKAHVASVIASQPYSEIAAGLIDDLGGTGRYPLFISGGDGANSVEELARSPYGQLPKIRPDDTALYMFSSGSTGIPKVVPHTHGELLYARYLPETRRPYEHDDVMINMMPGSHAMGFLSATGIAMWGGSTFYWSDPQPMMLSKGRFAHAIADNGVTTVIGVPFMYDAIASVADELDFSRVRTFLSGGVAMRKEIFERFDKRFGRRIRQAYGSTECLGISSNEAPEAEIIWDSVGTITPGVEFELVHADNPFGAEFGEIVVASPMITKGYLDAPEVNAQTLRDGKFYTGDLGTLAANGQLFVKGRTKLLIEVAGHKVDPFEIEEVLGTHPAVAEAVVVGVPDPRTGEQRLKAVIVRSADADADTLVRYCRERLASQKVPTLIEFRDEIPKSAAGKPLRGKLMEVA
ncbi:MAG: class I adenylate-forming enzyme family protein [Devosia sp.]